MELEVGGHYTREQVQDLLQVPEDQRGGNWDTGYNPFRGQLYVFCNVGSAGRTGHDYANMWDRDALVWYAKNGTRISQKTMLGIAHGNLPVHLFWRADSRKPDFTYAGLARTLEVEDTTPVRFRFAFGTAAAASSLGPSTSARRPRTLGDLVGADGRLWAKSEFGPVHDGWPAISFSSRKIAADFGREFQRGRDFVLFVGTGDPTSTENPEHRRRVLSAVTFEPRAPISTQQIVPGDNWEAAIAKWGIRWEWSLPVTEAWDFDPFPDAHEVMRHTYAALGSLASLGRCIPINRDDLPGLLACQLTPKPLELRAGVQQVIAMNPTDADLRRSLSQLALAIQQRIQQSGQERFGHHPARKGPNLSDLIATLNRKWAEQNGCCLLCDRPIPLKPDNRLLQMSPDRIDSAEKTYDAENLHLTHLGCNLAKNSASLEHWHEFLAHLRN